MCSNFRIIKKNHETNTYSDKRRKRSGRFHYVLRNDFDNSKSSMRWNNLYNKTLYQNASAFCDCVFANAI